MSDTRGDKRVSRPPQEILLQCEAHGGCSVNVLREQCMFMRFSRCVSVRGVNYKISEMVCGCVPKAAVAS